MVLYLAYLRFILHAIQTLMSARKASITVPPREIVQTRQDRMGVNVTLATQEMGSNAAVSNNTHTHTYTHTHKHTHTHTHTHVHT